MRKLVNSGTTQEELISPGPGSLPEPLQRYYSGRNCSQHYPSPDGAAGLAHCRSAVSLRPAVLAPGGRPPGPPATAGLAHCRSAVSLRPAVLAPGGRPPGPPATAGLAHCRSAVSLRPAVLARGAEPPGTPHNCRYRRVRTVPGVTAVG